jgi:hypothetical protein
MTNEERMARRLAACKMGLVKDKDGLRLPDDLWMQALPKGDINEALDLVNRDGIYECLDVIHEHSGAMLELLENEPFERRSFVLSAHVVIAAVKTMLKIMGGKF